MRSDALIAYHEVSHIELFRFSCDVRPAWIRPGTMEKKERE